jgi:hypothetical protein
MRSAICTTFLLGCVALAAEARGAGLPASCGDENAVINVSTHGHGAVPASPEAGQTKIVFIETAGKNTQPVITRAAVDGTWLGANRGNSYFEAAIAPGEHHVCVDWELPHRYIKDQPGFEVFTAESGKTYYFLVKVDWTANVEPVQLTRYDGDMSLHLAPVNVDEAQYLVQNSKISTATVR